MNSKFRKVLSVLMIIITVLSVVPVAAFSGGAVIAQAVQSDEEIFDYYIDDVYEEAYVDSINKNAEGDITFPETIGGYPAVYDSLYINNCDKVTSVTIPDGLSVPSISIEVCDSLKEIYIGDGVESVHISAAVPIENINVSKKNPNYTSVKGVLFNKDKTVLQRYPVGRTASKYTVPEGVTVLGSSAFLDSVYLEEIKMPDTVKEIKGNCFNNCVKLSKISFSDSLETIGYSAFLNCDSIKSIKLPESVVAISAYAFLSCDALTDVEIPKNLKTLDFSAFNGCSEIREIKLGAKITKMEYSYYPPFRNLSSLESITVDKKNKSYTSIDGVLFSKDKKELIKYPSEKSDSKYTVPSSVETIWQCAFEDSDNLKKIIFNDSLKNIGYLSFAYCDAITSVEIPDSVTNMAYRAFPDCDSLETVNIGSGVESTYISWFEGCDNLKTINVDKKNKYIASVDGVLYDKELTRIIDYPYGSPNESFKISADIVNAYNVNGINLKSIEVSSKNKNYTAENGILYNKEKTELVVYPDGKTDKTYTVPASVESVYFSNKYLKEYKVSSKNKTYSAIDGILYDEDGEILQHVPAKYNKTVTLSKKVEGKSWRAFQDCTEIKSFSVEKGNKVYFTKNGVLFAKSDYGNVLKCYPAAKKGSTYTIPENTLVNTDAFDNAVYLKKIYVPSSKTYFGVDFGVPDGVTVYYDHPEHTTKQKTVSATLKKNGAVKEVCTICDETVKTVSKIYYPKTIKLSETKYTYNGKVKTPDVTVKDSKGNTLKKGKDYTVKYSSGRKAPGKYSVTVTFKGKYSGKKKLYFTIAPSVVTLSSVKAGSKSATPAWKTVTGASGYEVMYSTSKKFKSAKTSTVKKGSAKNTTVKKLTKGKKYYFKVRAFKTIDGNKIYGAWSAVKSVKVK